MILFFTPNPCIERTLFVPEFAAPGSFRVAPAQLRVTAGGKGVNAARVAANLGAQVLSLAPAGKHQKNQLQAFLNEDGVEAQWVEVESPTRTTINVVHHGAVTEIVEAGHPLAHAEGELLIARFEALLPACELVVIGGSYPLAAPGDEAFWGGHAARLCAMVARAGKRVLYDGNGPAWKRALAGGSLPWAIKPNLQEAAALLGRNLETPADEAGAARELLQRGIEVVLLSCGARGLWLAWGGAVKWLHSPTIREVSAVGSGDSLVGAFAAKWVETGDLETAARWGVAAGAANAAQLEAARVGPGDVAPLVERVEVDGL